MHRLLVTIPVFALGCVAPVEHHDVAYDPRFGAANRMDLYLPDGDAFAHPTVLFIHGGSWSTRGMAAIGLEVGWMR